MTKKRIKGRLLGNDEFRLYPHGQLLNVLREQIRPYDKDDPREIPAPQLPAIPQPVSPAPRLPAPRAPQLPAPVAPGPGLPAPRPPSATLPAPRPAPALPAIPSPTSRPKISEIIRDYPGAPFDVSEGVPWDLHVYPPTPAPPKLPKSAAFQMKVAEAIKRALEDDEDYEPPQLEGPKPIPPGRRLPGGTVPPERRLPASVKFVPPADAAVFFDVYGLANPSDSEIRASLKNPDKLGLMGPTPLLMLDRYLEDAGIRHFSASEITKMWWRAPNGRRYKNVVKGSSTWWFTYELLPPDIFPRGVHYVLAEFCVPPPEMWPNMLPLLRVLDRFREWLGEPVRVVGSYRIRHYNERLPGSKNSFHLNFAALDFNFARKVSNGELDVAFFRRWFEATYRRLGDGVGAYPTFTHCDVGFQRHKLRGKSPDWTSRRRKDRTGLRKDATVP